MSEDIAGVCADLESIATRFKNEADRINTDDLMAAIDHTDTLLEALDSLASRLRNTESRIVDNHHRRATHHTH